MKALVAEGPHKAAFRDVELRPIKDNELLIKVKRAGICATDNAIYTGDCMFVRDGSIVYPCRFGHEWSGVVEKVGRDVKGFAPGDRVICDNGVSCGECEACREGRYDDCVNVKSVGTVNCWDGCFAEYMIMPVYHVYHIADSMSFDAAALLEPISIAYEAFKRTKLTKDSTVVITGTGAIAMGAVALAKYYGAGQIVCVGRKEPKLAVAKDMGATHLINNTKCSMPEEVKKITNGKGADLLIESSGSESCLIDCIMAAKKGGIVEILAFYEKLINNLPIDHMAFNSIDLHGCAGHYGNAEAVKKIFETKDYGLEKMITHRVKFDDCLEFFENNDKYRNEKIKVMIDFD